MFRTISKFLPFAGLFLAALIGSPAEATNFTVSNLNDSGSGSLRQAIDDANGTAGVDTITFTVSGTIVLGSTLPDITDAAGLTIDGTGQSVTVSGNQAVRVMIVDAGGILNLQNLTVANGRNPMVHDFYGNGIFNSGTLTISNSTITGNGGVWSAAFGGGTYNTGTLTVINSTFSHNDSGCCQGGGIYNEGTVTVTDSTFIGNGNDSHGGGISNEGTLSINNSTFSGNGVATFGGGISNGGTLTVTNSTFSGNSEGGGLNGGGSGIFNEGTLNLTNTILANSLEEECFNNGTFNASGINLVEDGSCGASSDPVHFITGDPLLGPLADNGGSTLTNALLAGSPAIDAADNTLCPATDQRGVARPQGIHCDIGAFELESPVDACITAGVLDNFNRHDGPIGRYWRGQTDDRFYHIHHLKMDVRFGGSVIWNPDRFGTNQAAFVTLSRVDTHSPAQGTLLKVLDGLGPHTVWKEYEGGKQHEEDVSFDGAISVAYDGQEQAVQVSTIRPGKRNWQSYGKMNVSFRNGDKLGGCALANGDVRVYKNDVLVTTVILDRADQTFFKDKRGKVGLWSYLAPNAVLDNFGGGTIKP